MMILGNKFFHFVVFLAYISKIIRSTYYIENLELFNDNNHIFEFCSSENHAGIGKLIQSIVSNNNDIEFNLKTTCHKNINVFTNFPNCYLNYSGAPLMDRTCLLTPPDRTRRIFSYKGDCSEDSLLEFVNNMTQGFYSLRENSSIARLGNIIEQSIKKSFQIHDRDQKCDRVKLSELNQKTFLNEYILKQKPLVIEDFTSLIHTNKLYNLLSQYLSEK
jgi:hypothetical protein